MRTRVVGVLALLVCAAVVLASQQSPEKVTIGASAAWFAPVEFSHGVHAEIAGDCVSCHHFSEGQAAPCATCHEQQTEVTDAASPSLKVAYHKRCMGCHRDAGSGPVDCEGCHGRKALPPGPPLGKS